MNLNANTLILPHVNEALNILLTISAKKDYNSQAEIVGEDFTDACANTDPVHHKADAVPSEVVQKQKGSWDLVLHRRSNIRY